MEERGLVTDRMILPRFRAIWRRWHRGAALFGPYQAKLEHSKALRQQRRLAMERERREASIAVAAALNARAAFLRNRAAPLIAHNMGTMAYSPNSENALTDPEHVYTPSDPAGGAPKSNDGMRTRAGKREVRGQEITKKMLQTRAGYTLGQSKNSQDCVGSSMQRMRAELCWPVAPPPLSPSPQEPSFAPSNLVLDGVHSDRLPQAGDSSNRRRGPNRHSRDNRGGRADGSCQRGDRERSMRPMAGPVQSPKSGSGGAVLQSLPQLEGPQADRARATPSSGRQRTTDAGNFAGMASSCSMDAVQVADPVKWGEISKSGKSRKAQDYVAKFTDPMASTSQDSGWQARAENIPFSKVQERQSKQRRDGRRGHLPTRTGEQNAMKEDRRGFPGRALESPDGQMKISHPSTSSGPAYMSPARPLISTGELSSPAPAVIHRLQVDESPPAASVPVFWTVPQEMDLPFFF